MEIIVKLKLSSPYELSIEEIEKDIRNSEDLIGWCYDYEIESVQEVKEPTLNTR